MRRAALLLFSIVALVGCDAAVDPLVAAKDRAAPSSPGKTDQLKMVSLLDATKGVGLGCYGQCGDLLVEVRVLNVAYEKRVALVYSVDGGEWTSWEGQFDAFLDDEGSTERWTIYLPYLPSRDSTVRFAIAYEVAGETYWDNNGGWDHEY